MPPATHSFRRISSSRLVFLSAIAVLAGLIIWVAVRAVGPAEGAGGQPTVVLPSTSAVPVEAVIPSPPVSVRPAPPPSSLAVAVVSPSPARSRSHSPSPRPPSPSPTHTTSAAFTATVTVSSSWGGGYVASVLVVNNGTKAASWSVSVTHDGFGDIRLSGTWNAQGSQDGSTLVFTAGSLAPGQSATFGYQAFAPRHGGGDGGPTQPSGCSVTTGSCRVS